MKQAFLDSDSLVRVEAEHLGEQIAEFRGDIREKVGPFLFGPFRQRFNVLDGVFVSYVLHVIGRRSPKDRDNALDLIQEVFAREQRSPAQQLSNNAPDRPDIDGFGVFAGIQDDLRGTIPTCYHILSLLLFFLHKAPRESKIANLEVAFLSEEQIRGFEIAVDDIG